MTIDADGGKPENTPPSAVIEILLTGRPVESPGRIVGIWYPL